MPVLLGFSKNFYERLVGLGRRTNLTDGLNFAHRDGLVVRDTTKIGLILLFSNSLDSKGLITVKNPPPI